MFWICFGIAAGLLIYYLFAPREEEVILIMPSEDGIEWDNG